MTRTIRPIGPVSESLRKAGYRQYAAIFVDGEQVPNIAVISKPDGNTVKFVGHWIDDNGEVHTTRPLADMKKAASRILTIREQSPAPSESDGPMIDCKACGHRHSDDTLCPED